MRGFPNCLISLTLLLLSFCFQCHANRPVFAHYMLYAPSGPDNLDGYKAEIRYAKSKGIDAFALNTNNWEDVYKTRADGIYQAADELGFKIFFSLDMHRDNTHLTAENVKEMITRYSSRASQYSYNGKQFVSTWLGNEDTVFDGYSNALEGWNKAVFDQIGGRDKYYFVTFFPTGGTEQEVTSMINKFNSLIDGLYAWDTSAWPYSSADNFNSPSNDKDQAYLRACKNARKSYMASVSPWFFKHDGCCNDVCTTPKDQTSCGCQVKGNYQGSGLWIKRWEQIIKDQPDFVEIVTWNDWVERTYVAKMNNPNWGPQQSNDQDFPHEAFLELGSYYISWYKTGQQPSITDDSVFIFYYSQSAKATATNDPCKPQNGNVLDDRVYVVTKLKSPASVEVQSGGSTQRFPVKAGVTTVSMPFQKGQQSAKVTRDGAQILQVVGSKGISNSFSTYDYNVYSGFSALILPEFLTAA
ncbi:glucan endo-1,3-alpha-glucosidase agn1 [Selaginella moellendorffii]|uniref:glucan endo-1,3-alpha-glucosidase agn1 n=1 Tax=Selaginella moellendorffii TaxID=88036 RepID=UPI000D1CB330|nr:glucan endo-1,3-alpha-glucosidase agn1 [Selaginella moellendorffii]|eukprot:XP_024527548.1 glucan endo-1,3-alpha-glucosidase agn1 [Selaginella moellendorffii]